jgi:hypothetical protein
MQGDDTMNNNNGIKAAKFKRGNDCYTFDFDNGTTSASFTIDKRYGEWFLTVDFVEGETDRIKAGMYAIAATKRDLVHYVNYCTGNIEANWPLRGIYG